MGSRGRVTEEAEARGVSSKVKPWGAVIRAEMGKQAELLGLWWGKLRLKWSEQRWGKLRRLCELGGSTRPLRVTQEGFLREGLSEGKGWVKVERGEEGVQRPWKGLVWAGTSLTCLRQRKEVSVARGEWERKDERWGLGHGQGWTVLGLRDRREQCRLFVFITALLNYNLYTI